MKTCKLKQGLVIFHFIQLYAWLTLHRSEQKGGAIEGIMEVGIMMIMDWTGLFLNNDDHEKMNIIASRGEPLIKINNLLLPGLG